MVGVGVVGVAIKVVLAQSNVAVDPIWENLTAS